MNAANTISCNYLITDGNGFILGFDVSGFLKVSINMNVLSCKNPT